MKRKCDMYESGEKMNNKIFGITSTVCVDIAALALKMTEQNVETHSHNLGIDKITISSISIAFDKILSMEKNNRFLHKSNQCNVSISHRYEDSIYFNVSSLVDFIGEYTLAIIKPDACEKENEIIKMLEEHNLKIALNAGAQLKIKKTLNMDEARKFYHVHSQKSFFEDNCKFMASGPCVIMVLCGQNAIKRYRELMGATDPNNAAEGTIRKAYGSSIDNNAVHGSDSPENAIVEINQFFPEFLR